MRVVSVIPLYFPACHAFTASRSAGTHGPVRSRAVTSSSSAWLGSATFDLRRAIVYIGKSLPSPRVWGTKTDSWAGLFGRLHQFSNRVENHFELRVILLFHLIQAARQITMRSQHF